ncbi:MAG: hypothetical protein M3R63_19165 [Actinomycetota bacterium]|nr:hypothetical protein [Actinomycetota bacterium]
MASVVTQSSSLAGAERMVRDYLALELDAQPASFTVRITPEVDAALTRELLEARAKAAEATKLQQEAAALSRNVARTLKWRCRMSGADVAAVLGVSPRRASQLIND